VHKKNAKSLNPAGQSAAAAKSPHTIPPQQQTIKQIQQQQAYA
jgi:hypothetical protein